MSGPKRNEDKLNTIGIVVVGICGAVLVYVTIVALQAFYMNDTSDPVNTADYGGQESSLKAMKADQMRHITETGVNAGTAGTYHVAVDHDVMMKIVAAAKTNDGVWVPAIGASKCRTSLPIPGRGHPDPAPGAVEGCPGATAAPAPAAPAAPATGSGAGSAEAPAAGSAAADGSAAGGHAR